MIRIASLLLTLGLCLSRAAAAETPLRVATCARTITTGVGAAFAVAMKLGWFRQEGLAVERDSGQTSGPPAPPARGCGGRAAAGAGTRGRPA